MLAIKDIWDMSLTKMHHNVVFDFFSGGKLLLLVQEG